jgi:CIC family chloride channel protein
MALPVGALAGSVIIVFRLVIEHTQSRFLPGHALENYEGLSALLRFTLPLGGALCIGLGWQFLADQTRQVGITHVMERLAYYQGRLPWRNVLAQFVGAALSIVCGHSVGREGPSVHLGAASGSLLGQWLHLPNNSIRILIACGVAAAIAASFNTPLAGVIFAMEVVMMEYTIIGFTPVILASVCATALSRAVFGSSPAFQIPALELGSLIELSVFVVMGMTLGTLAALFTHLMQLFTRTGASWPVWIRMTLGGAATGLIGVVVPQVMGIGYDTVDSMLLGQIGLVTLVGLTFAKLLATAAGLGMGLPGGLIGPTLVIGAAAGGAIGIVVKGALPIDLSSHAFYALIGMGTMMGATLQAPLAALTAMLELSANPHIILPGMLAVITAGLVSREVFGKESVYLELIRARGLDYRNDPVMQALRRTGVASVMDRRVAVLEESPRREAVLHTLSSEPRWILVRGTDGSATLMPAADLARVVHESENAIIIDLTAIPAQRLQSVAIDFQASLQEALAVLDSSQADVLHVVRLTVPGIERVYGILTRDDVEHGYHV